MECVKCAASIGDDLAPCQCDPTLCFKCCDCGECDNCDCSGMDKTDDLEEGE